MEGNDTGLKWAVAKAAQDMFKNAYFFGLYVGLLTAHNLAFDTNYELPVAPEKWLDEE